MNSPKTFNAKFLLIIKQNWKRLQKKNVDREGEHYFEIIKIFSRVVYRSTLENPGYKKLLTLNCGTIFLYTKFLKHAELFRMF